MNDHPEAISILREILDYTEDEMLDLFFKISQINPGVLVAAHQNLISTNLTNSDKIIFRAFKEGNSKMECIKIDRDLTDNTLIESKENVERIMKLI